MAGEKQDNIWPLPKFYFSVPIDEIEYSFQEVSGLESETQVIDYRHGNSKQFSTIKMPGVSKISNVIVYFFIKYFVFYILMMFKNKDYTLIDITSLKSGQDIFMYLWLFLFLPVVMIILFSVPIYFALKLGRLIILILILTGFLIAEYFVYTYFASQTNSMNGIYNGIISLILFLIFFFKRIIQIVSHNITKAALWAAFVLKFTVFIF